MSLDVYLMQPGCLRSPEQKIYIREAGQTLPITVEEWNQRYPDRSPITVETCESDQVYSANITHNLGAMAAEASIYQHLWRPEEIGIQKAGQLIEPLAKAILEMKADPARFEKHNAPNGWGLYEHFVPWIERYLEACRQYPDAEITVSR